MLCLALEISSTSWLTNDRIIHLVQQLKSGIEGLCCRVYKSVCSLFRLINLNTKSILSEIVRLKHWIYIVWDSQSWTLNLYSLRLSDLNSESVLSEIARLEDWILSEIARLEDWILSEIARLEDWICIVWGSRLEDWILSEIARLEHWIYIVWDSQTWTLNLYCLRLSDLNSESILSEIARLEDWILSEIDLKTEYCLR